MTALSRLAALVVLCSAPAVADDAPLREMEVAGAFPLGDDTAGVLLLRSKEEPELLLPIVVGRPEVDAIGRRLRHEPAGKPRTQDLLEHAIDALGGKVVRVEIRDAPAAAFEARVLVDHGARRISLDARPSDSVALALGTRAPIFATAQLLAASGLTKADVEKLRDRVSNDHAADAAQDVDM